MGKDLRKNRNSVKWQRKINHEIRNCFELWENRDVKNTGLKSEVKSLTVKSRDYSRGGAFVKTEEQEGSSFTCSLNKKIRKETE